MNKEISLKIQGEAIRFNVTPELYHKYIDEVQMTKKVAPAHNFLMRAVAKEDKDALRKILDLPGAAVQIVGQVIEEYAPDLEILLGE